MSLSTASPGRTPTGERGGQPRPRSRCHGLTVRDEQQLHRQILQGAQVAPEAPERVAAGQSRSEHGDLAPIGVVHPGDMEHLFAWMATWNDSPTSRR